MPYRNEHAARVRDPKDFQPDSFRRKNIEDGIDIIIGKLKGEDKMTTQAYRFDAEKYTAAQAKKWLKDHDIDYISFEEAKKEMDTQMLYKNTTNAVKDVDTKEGIVTGYFSVFGNKDSDGDIVMPGAFKKSLQENGVESAHPRILHLFMHNPYQVLAKPYVLKEDAKGLYFESKISKTSLGMDVIKLYADKVLTEHSIGYQIVKREVDEVNEITKLIEVKLWEGSTVTWGANPEALVQDVKMEGKAKVQLDDLLAKLDALTTAIKGNYTDDIARQLEIMYYQIKSQIKSLVEMNEPDSSTRKVNEPIDEVKEFERILNILKI